MKIIKRTLEKNKKAWDSKLKMALWADRITIKRAIGMSPFELVYGSKATILVNNILLVYKFIQENDIEMSDPLKERMELLAEFNEIREDAHRRNLKLKQKSKYFFNKKSPERKF